MTERDLRTLMQRSTQHIRASDRLRAELLDGRRSRRSTARGGWVVGAAALAAAAVLVTSFAFRPAGAPPVPVSPVELSVVVTGRLVVVGGPAPGSPRPLVGTVVAHHGTATDVPVAASAPTGAGGRFSLTVPPGTYELTGTSPLMDGGQGLCLSSPGHGDPLRVGYRDRGDLQHQLAGHIAGQVQLPFRTRQLCGPGIRAYGWTRVS